jgi:SAM-dependent methyltransferase
MTALAFDPARYKAIQRERWDRAAPAWDGCGPLLEHWLREATELMLDQAGVGPGSRVLDVAAGTGGQTLLAARRTGPDGVLLATDIAELLIERVRANAIAEGVLHVYATVADAEQLDFDPAAFDAAICRLGLMFLPDVAAALRSIRAALRPGGRFSAIVYDEPEHNPLLVRAGTPAPGEPGPFSLSAPGVLEAALRGAGFGAVEVEHIDAPLSLPSAADASDCLRALLSDLDEAELGAFEGPSGFSGPCRLLVAGGRRP